MNIFPEYNEHVLIFMGFLSRSRQMLKYNLKLCHCRFSNSWFTGHPVARHCVTWATGSAFK
jgi:hypothetical protein